VVPCHYLYASSEGFMAVLKNNNKSKSSPANLVHLLASELWINIRREW